MNKHAIAIAAGFSCQDAPNHIVNVCELGSPAITAAGGAAAAPEVPGLPATIFGIKTEYVILGIIVLIVLFFVLRRS